MKRLPIKKPQFFTNMMKKEELESYLSQFIGTTKYYRHWSNKLVYTDGIHGLIEAAEASWLVDLVASYQVEPKIAACPVQFWRLRKTDGSSAIVTMREDSDQPILVQQEIEYTDFPLDEQEVWLFDGVLILPSEY